MSSLKGIKLKFARWVKPGRHYFSIFANDLINLTVINKMFSVNSMRGSTYSILFTVVTLASGEVSDTWKVFNKYLLYIQIHECWDWPCIKEDIHGPQNDFLLLPWSLCNYNIYLAVSVLFHSIDGLSFLLFFSPFFCSALMLFEDFSLGHANTHMNRNLWLA